MDIKHIRSAISQPISEDSPVGLSVADDPSYDFIEEQMMKVGSLSHGTVEWKKAEDAAIKLLSENSKDLKVLIALLQCFHHRNTSTSFALSLFILTDFVTLYWKTCFPFAGEKGKLSRSKFFSQIIQRFELALDKLDLSQCNSAHLNELNEAAVYWDENTEKMEFDTEAADAVVAKIRRLTREAVQRLELNKTNQATAKATATPSSSSSSANSRVLTVDTSSDKAIKQSLLQMATFLADKKDALDLSVRIRRYALWGAITSLPEHTDNKSLVSAIPKDRINEYLALFDNADQELWNRVENTLSMAPFWFDGQHLSYQIAQKLGHQSCAQSILQETQNFLQRLPQLHDFSFRSGDPFLSDECKEWLETEVESSGNKRKSTRTHTNDWSSRKKQVVDLVKSDGLAAGLAKINAGISNAKEPREHYYWRLLSTELLEESDLNELAMEQYQQLHTQIESMTVSEWEPSLLKRIQKHITVK